MPPLPLLSPAVETLSRRGGLFKWAAHSNLVPSAVEDPAFGPDTSRTGMREGICHMSRLPLRRLRLPLRSPALVSITRAAVQTAQETKRRVIGSTRGKLSQRSKGLSLRVGTRQKQNKISKERGEDEGQDASWPVRQRRWMTGAAGFCVSFSSFQMRLGDPPAW